MKYFVTEDEHVLLFEGFRESEVILMIAILRNGLTYFYSFEFVSCYGKGLFALR